MTNLDLMQSIKTKWGAEIDAACKTSSVPATRADCTQCTGGSRGTVAFPKADMAAKGAKGKRKPRVPQAR